MKIQLTEIGQDKAWQCLGRFDYSLTANIYTIDYCRWNTQHSAFDPVAEKVVYSLLPDGTYNHISYYERNQNSDSLCLAWQMPITDFTQHPNYFLTRR